MDILILSNYWHFPKEKASSRYHSIASMATAAGHRVEIVTSTFYHTKKQQRQIKDMDLNACSYNATLLFEPGYKKNVSLKRIVSHRVFSKNVLAFLQNRKHPDVIYLCMPPTGLAEKVVAFAIKFGIRIIIDIQDLWPEAFAMLMPSFVAKTMLFPMQHSANFAYRHASEIVAVSDAYVQRALSVNKTNAKGVPVFIGTDLNIFDAAAKKASPLEGRLRPITLAYIGMLGHSYDLCAVMDSMKILRDQGFDEVEFLVMGDGPLREKFESYATEHNLPVRFTGRLSYEVMVQTLVGCDIAINVLNENSVASIINKHADYVSAALPVINIQKDSEFNDLLRAYHAGIPCPLGNSKALAEAIKTLAKDPALRTEMGKNSRRLASEKFDRQNSYQDILSLF